MIKKTSPQAFFFGQEFDRFCQSGNTGIGRRKRTRIRTPHLFAHIVHFVPVILGSNERRIPQGQDLRQRVYERLRGTFSGWNASPQEEA